MNRLMRMAVTTITGAAIGGGLALMYSPSSGTRNRKRVMSKYRRLKEEVDRLSLVVSEQADHVKKEMVDSISRLKTEVRQSAATVSNNE